MGRESLEYLTAIPNIGKAMEREFHLLGISRPADLIGRDPYLLYERLCEVTQVRQSLCAGCVYFSGSVYGRWAAEEVVGVYGGEEAEAWGAALICE